jgi:hypothetical protein
VGPCSVPSGCHEARYSRILSENPLADHWVKPVKGDKIYERIKSATLNWLEARSNHKVSVTVETIRR